MFKVYPYRQGSASARALADALGGRVLRLQNSRYRPNRRDIVINWGNTNVPDFPLALNFNGVRSASNKLEFFRTVSGIDATLVPEFWTDRGAIPDASFQRGVVCRTVLAGHSGEGIVIANSRDDLVPAPLYTQYVNKQDEYRIHVGRRGDETVIISIQRKARRHDHADPNWQVRNLANGFVYARADVNPPRCVLDVAYRTLACLDLDFGAVDVIYNRQQDRAYALEVNTAPGLSGSTVDDYVAYFTSITPDHIGG